MVCGEPKRNFSLKSLRVLTIAQNRVLIAGIGLRRNFQPKAPKTLGMIAVGERLGPPFYFAVVANVVDFKITIHVHGRVAKFAITRRASIPPLETESQSYRENG